MKAITLAVLLLTGCTGGTGAPPPPGSPGVISAPSTPEAAASTTPRPAPPTSSPVTNGVYTATDQEIAELLRAGGDQAIARLKLLNDMDPGQLEDLFLPLGTWITNQRTSVEAHTPSDCTADAVARFMAGIDAYDAIRKEFLAWRDWGAHGHSFHPEAPRQAAALFEEALVELTAHCPA